MNRGTRAPDLGAEESRYRALIDNQGDGILVVSHEGTIRFANQAATRLLNRSADELIGRSFGVPIIPGENTEIDLHLAGGAVRVAEMRVVSTTWEDSPALLASLRDISERKGLEDQLRQKVQELAEADRRKDEFLAMLAHELRNPLAPIRNGLELLLANGVRDAAVDLMRVKVELDRGMFRWRP